MDNPDIQRQPDEVERAINDPEQVAQANRIRSLLDRRTRCIDALEAATVAKAQSEADESQAKLTYIAHLRSLVVDLYSLVISDEDNEELQELFEEKELGSFEVQPPEKIPHTSDLVPGEKPAETQDFTVEGLQWFLEQEFPLTVEWSVEVRSQSQPVTARKEVIPSLTVCIKASQAVVSCMQELGLEAETYTDEGDYGFDYDTIDVHEEHD